MTRAYLLAGAASLLAMSGAARAQDNPTTTAPAPTAKTDPASGTPDNGTTAAPAEADDAIVVTARRLDAARAAIATNLGASSYSITNQTIQDLPGGDNQQFNQIVLQLPGVVQDGGGQLHVRDDHNGLQYRINGTILPEGISVFGQTLSPRLVEKFNLLTGALPAQYGLRTAGIIDITTKSGMRNNGGTVSLYGGSHGTIEPSGEYGGSTGATTFFVSGDFRHDKLGIESVDGSSTPIHDKTNQQQLFTYADHVLGDSDRVSFIGGYSNQKFQIPNPRGLDAAVDGTGFDVGGRTSFASEDLDERQHELTGFGIASWLHDAGPLTIQTSLFGRYSSLNYYPDRLGELLFNGQAQRATKHDTNFGVQSEAAYKASAAHTIRFGIILSRDHATSRTTTAVFPVLTFGNGQMVQLGQPVDIVDNGSKSIETYSAYLQDEWKLAETLTFNFGGRFDRYEGYRSEQQFSPRANLVWTPADGTAVHVGYARYFSPPPSELVANTSIARFVGTSAEAPGATGTTPFAERQNYFDAGIQQKIGSAITFGVDSYYRRSHNLIDEGQFGAPIILTPFNYRRGKIYGVEGNLSYAQGPWLAYANFAYAKAQGKDIVSSEFNFDPADLAYIQNHYIYLDHDQTYTGSAGLSYRFKEGALAGSQLGASMIYGSGLRADGAVPNGRALKDYAQVNLSASHRFEDPGIEVRFDVTNVGDHKYLIRDGSGIGVGAPQYGPRRGYFVGVSKDF